MCIKEVTTLTIAVHSWSSFGLKPSWTLFLLVSPVSPYKAELAASSVHTYMLYAYEYNNSAKFYSLRRQILKMPTCMEAVHIILTTQGRNNICLIEFYLWQKLWVLTTWNNHTEKNWESIKLYKCTAISIKCTHSSRQFSSGFFNSLSSEGKKIKELSSIC